jgi:putative pyruvate formate lyase activating enzyme
VDNINLKELSEETLWNYHNQLRDNPSSDIQTANLPSLLDLKIELAYRMLKACRFCENRCTIDRTQNREQKQRLGVCGVDETAYLSSSFLHMGEEAPLVPSGTIFFAGCTFDCCFCQNSDISAAGKSFRMTQAGHPIDPLGLAQLADQLARKGALNINYVGGDPTPNLHVILHSMKFQTHKTCQLWNSNLYNSPEALDLLLDVFDVWLPDFKYGNNECARLLSGISHYFDILTRNLKIIATRGTRNIIIRHLVLPGHIECCSKPVLAWIARECPQAVVNIMGQYRPEYRIAIDYHPEINRRPSASEMSEVFSYAKSLDIEFESVS